MSLLSRLLRASSRRWSVQLSSSRSLRTAATTSMAIVLAASATVPTTASSPPSLFDLAKQENERQAAKHKEKLQRLEEEAKVAGVRLRKILLAQTAPGMPLSELASEGVTRAFVSVSDVFGPDVDVEERRFFLARFLVEDTDQNPLRSAFKYTQYKIVAGMEVGMHAQQTPYGFSSACIQLDWSKAYPLSDQEHEWLQEADTHLGNLPRLSVRKFYAPSSI
jgi:hypothetical protein